MPLSLGILAGFVALAVIFTLFYRYGVKIPMRPFFTVTSVLLYYMAFVFLGKGIRELQEGNVIPITVMPRMPSIPSMGMFPSGDAAPQAILLVLFIFMIVKTFLPLCFRRGARTDRRRLSFTSGKRTPDIRSHLFAHV